VHHFVLINFILNDQDETKERLKHCFKAKFIVCNNQDMQQSKCVSVNEWKKKMCYVLSICVLYIQWDIDTALLNIKKGRKYCSVQQYG
jgi:hypothetical protein